MSSLFPWNSNTKRDSTVKEALISHLEENSREIEYEIKQRGRNRLELCEVSNALCTTIEAIFLHGLKDSFLWQTLNAIAGDETRRPEPSFWSPIMVFLHKQDIREIQSLTQLTNEIGQCRAWVRLTLNDALLSAYLNNIRKNSGAFNPYYKKYAFVKDAQCLEMAIKVITALEAYVEFDLPVNSSLLNYWTDYALQLSGLWTPALKNCPVSSGIDIAGSLSLETPAIPTPQPVRTNELFSESISNSPFKRIASGFLDDANCKNNVDMILQEAESINDSSKFQANGPAEVEDQTRQVDSTRAKSFSHGNSLSNLMQRSWTDDTSVGAATIDHNDSTRFFQRSLSVSSGGSSNLRPHLGDRSSYNALIKKHERNREVDWTEVWETFLMHNSMHLMKQSGDRVIGDSEKDEFSSDDSSGNSDFEVISKQHLEKFGITELQEMVEHLCTLAREPGLDNQGFLCKSCQHPLGIGYLNFHVCAFSGNYYCEKCMNLEPLPIPAKIIYNWDFRKYRISKRAAAFLTEFRNQPFLDLKLLNPDIYPAFEAMAELQSLRIRLNFIRAYIFTCSPSSMEDLRNQFLGKDYLYEHIHQYSITDLAAISRGALFSQLHKAYKMGEGHILKCPLCSVKGFICEICQSPRVLYPFHIDTTYRCRTCGAVYHPQCLNERQPCPKCERHRKRELEPLAEDFEGLTPNYMKVESN